MAELPGVSELLHTRRLDRIDDNETQALRNVAGQRPKQPSCKRIASVGAQRRRHENSHKMTDSGMMLRAEGPQAAHEIVRGMPVRVGLQRPLWGYTFLFKISATSLILAGERFLEGLGILNRVLEWSIEHDEEIASGVIGLMLLHLEEALKHSHRIVLHLPNEQPFRLVGPESCPMVAEVSEAAFDGIERHASTPLI